MAAGGSPRGTNVPSVRDLYIILSVIGWAWCLPVAAYLWIRVRRDARLAREAPARRGATDGPALRTAAEGRPEAEA